MDFPWRDAGGRLRDLAAKGLSAGQIALILSGEYNATLTRSAVIGRLSREHIRPAQQPPLSRPQPPDIALPSGKPRKPVSFMGLQAHHCRWPIDTPKGIFYCGEAKVGLSYCADHCKRAYQR